MRTARFGPMASASHQSQARVLSRSLVCLSSGVGSYGDVEVVGWDQELTVSNDRFLLIHPTCLSFLSRHNRITPRELWESFYGEDVCHYPVHLGPHNGLIYGVDYYHMEGRSEQSFSYALERQQPPVDRPDLEQRRWCDPETMEECNWLLARPTVLPTSQTLIPTTVMAPASKGRKIFEIGELFDNILTHIVDVPADVIEVELRTNQKYLEGGKKECIFEAPSAVVAAQTLLSLAQVDRWFHHEIIHKRQDYFIRVIRNFGWMLPLTPEDWSDSKWPSDLFEDTPPSSRLGIDWRGYMLTCLKKSTPNIRNRWRFHKMAMQFARGKHYMIKDRPQWRWKAGSLYSEQDLKKPIPESWELPSTADDEKRNTETVN
ncbi:hypothetical protein F5884DRAFT_343407 [Xylogone sp. PMI_703]|nr:hypothetical protein F5884DRAFT_343407 [Xylogone sp. PMI_703]